AHSWLWCRLPACGSEQAGSLHHKSTPPKTALATARGPAIMPSKRTATLASCPLLLGLASLVPAADAPPKVTYQEHAGPIFRARCGSCHNADKQKGGLSLETYGGAMQGGGSGAVIAPGDPDSSTLWMLVTHAEEPHMPPNQPKLPD